MIQEKLTYQNKLRPVFFNEAEFYQQYAVVGTDAGTVALQNAYAVTITPDGTNDVSFRVKAGPGLLSTNPDYSGVAQVMNNILLGNFATPGTWKTEVQGASFNDGTKVTVNATIPGLQQQIQCAIATGTCTTAGNLVLSFTSALHNGGTEIEVLVPVGTGVTQNGLATLCKNALSTVIGTVNFTTAVLTGTDANKFTVTTKGYLANDSTMAADWASDGTLVTDGTWTGTHTNTAVGTALPTRAAATLIIGTAVAANETVGSFCAVSYGTDALGTQAAINLTCGTPAVNDTSLNFTFVANTATGPTASASTIATAGDAPNDAVWFTIPKAAPLTISPPGNYMTKEGSMNAMWFKSETECQITLTYWGFPGLWPVNEQLT